MNRWKPTDEWIRVTEVAAERAYRDLEAEKTGDSTIPDYELPVHIPVKHSFIAAYIANAAMEETIEYIDKNRDWLMHNLGRDNWLAFRRRERWGLQ